MCSILSFVDIDEELPEAAITYAKAGANVTIAWRSQETLDKNAAAIREIVPGVHVLAVPTDALCPTSLKVTGLVENHVRLVSLNVAPNAELGKKDPDLWRNTFEVNVWGFTILFETSLESDTARHCRLLSKVLRVPHSSDYCTSKHASTNLLYSSPFTKLIEEGVPDDVTLDTATAGRNNAISYLWSPRFVERKIFIGQLGYC
ncbi:hypothetical protein V8E53_004906 [Lactarius tabidus]